MHHPLRFSGGRLVIQTFQEQGVTADMTRLERWLTRLWTCTLWTGGVGCPCLRRWALLHAPWGKLFLHRFFADDWSLDLHDHSGRMVSIGLSGAYEEETPTGTRIWRAPWIRTFPATWTHRLRLVTPVVWTLVWVGRKQRRSGFWYQGRWWNANQYLLGPATSRRSCGNGPLDHGPVSTGPAGDGP